MPSDRLHRRRRRIAAAIRPYGAHLRCPSSRTHESHPDGPNDLPFVPAPHSPAGPELVEGSGVCEAGGGEDPFPSPLAAVRLPSASPPLRPYSPTISSHASSPSISTTAGATTIQGSTPRRRGRVTSPKSPARSMPFDRPS